MRKLRRGNAATVIIIVLVVFVVVGIACCGIVAALLLPAIGQARMAAQRMQSSNNMKQIALALHNYHDVHGTLPPASIPDENGNPKHSWRVLILPYIEANYLYDQYDFDQPWDSAQNRKVAEQMPAVYISPALDDPTGSKGMTSYVALAGPKTVLNTEQGLVFREIKAGTSNTIMVVEDTTNPVPWTKPTDISPQAFLSKNLDDGYFHGANMALTDGSVRFFDESQKPEVAGMVSIDGS